MHKNKISTLSIWFYFFELFRLLEALLPAASNSISLYSISSSFSASKDSGWADKNASGSREIWNQMIGNINEKLGKIINWIITIAEIRLAP